MPLNDPDDIELGNVHSDDDDEPPAAAPRGAGAGRGRGAAAAAAGTAAAGDDSAGGDGDSDDAGANDGEFMKEMKTFFDAAKGIKDTLATIEANIATITEQQSIALGATSKNAASKATARLTDLGDEVDAALKSVANRLKQLDAENKAQAEKTPNSAQMRIRTNAHNSMTRKMVSLMTEYQRVQADYKKQHGDRLVRQIKIVNPNATQDQVDAVLQSGGGERVFAMMMSSAAGHMAARNAVQNIQERHAEIIQVEESLRELNQLFLDMAVLVEAQGEMLDQIEHSVQQSAAYVETGVENLRKANDYAKRARKKMCCIAIILLCVLAAVLGPALGFGLRRA